MTIPQTYDLSDPKSFAFSTARQRWPTILLKAQQDVQKFVNLSNNEELKLQGKNIVHAIEQIIENIKNNSPLRLFTDAEILLIPSLQSYNDDLKKLDSQPTWLSGPWLLIECYLYRLLDLRIKSESKWIDYDIFENQKREAFESSAKGIYELAIRVKHLSEQLKNTSVEEEKLKALFEEFIDISLWGNATDLSLLANATLEDIQSRQGKEARAKSAENVVDNDLPQAWKHLISVPQGKRRIDVVLDNAGFEFYTDLALTIFLLDAKLVDSVVFHCKTRPWMVSDTMIKDYKIFIDDMLNEKVFPDHHDELQYFVNSIEHYKSTGQFSLTDSEFWTSSLDYWNLGPEETKYGGAELYHYLQSSCLVIIKGDLNYRKLTGDRQWPRTTPFKVAIQSLSSSNIPILALRTCKADVCVGLDEGMEEQLIKKYKNMGNDSGELWCSCGKWAVISFCSGNEA
ncbi:hypothetical protein CANINC_004675 [Pichia inconspicua]|uniref:Sugar phosphate phosphatase n=1 Tax=Pichia inconspicua TaxID=52247 RepID=A0A4T0WW58_9ASCO|nr:hypothetical protein CANINC_004675 [[Candida] inconspicua]